ncbi:MAG: serine/threonine protein kinase [Planctomycetota bacterium]|nr:MAG: serine/threonine protein kinase [Planctomycetota bacterium]
MAGDGRSDLCSDPTRISSTTGNLDTAAGATMGNTMPRIPQVHIEGELGRGGMGVVWHGRQEYIDRPVAVKVLTAEHGLDDAFRRRFQREAKILADFNHPNLVSCYAAGVNDDGHCYLVMERIHGSDLRSYLSDHGPLAPSAVIELGIAMSLALEHIWAKGVIHRDVKCENILCEQTPSSSILPFTPKLADVGLAKPTANSPSSDGMDLTISGMIVGTPSTMAPEQFDSPDAIDHRADMYALGCVLFQAVSGSRAFPQRGLSQLMVAKASLPSLEQWQERSTSPALFQLIQACLQPDPQHRPADYTLLRQALEACRDASPRSTGRASLRRRLMTISGVSAALLLVALLALQWSLRDASALPSDSSAHSVDESTPPPPSHEELVSSRTRATEAEAGQDSHPDWSTGLLWRDDFIQRLADWQQPQGGWGAAEEIDDARFPFAIDGFAVGDDPIILRRQWRPATRGLLVLTFSPRPDLAGESFDDFYWQIGHEAMQVRMRVQHLGTMALVTIRDSEGNVHGPLTVPGDGTAQPWTVWCSWDGGILSIGVAEGDDDTLTVDDVSAISAIEFAIDNGGVRVQELRYDPQPQQP